MRAAGSWLLIALTAGVAAPAVAQDGPILREPLPNHAVAIVQARPGSGTFALRVAARGGAFEDPPGKDGLTSLLSRMLLRGTTRLPAVEHALAVERTGSTLDPFDGRLGLGLESSGPAEALPAVLDLVLEAALSPRLDAADLAKEVTLMRQSLSTSLDRPSTGVDRAALPMAFGDHPLGRVADPRAWLEGIGVDDIRRAHAARFAGRRLIVVVVGDADRGEVLARIRKAVSGVPEGDAPLPPPPSPAPLAEPARARVKRSTSQPEVLVARPTPGIEPADRAAMDLLMHLLTGFEERLSAEIREKRGWAYWVRAVDWRFPGAGLYGVRTAVPKKHLDETERIILEEMSRIGESAPSPKEVERGRRFLLTAHARAWQRSASRAAWLSAWELKGEDLLSFDDFRRSLDRVTPVMIRDLARRLDAWSAPVIVTLH